MNRNRFEAFSDGVFAIAATLLVLDVRLPNADMANSTALFHALLALWPQYVSYATSFLLIGIFWMNHHSVMHYVSRIDRSIVWRNLVLLMFIAFLPFPTAIVARYGDMPAAAMFYGVVLFLTAAAVNIAWQHIVRGGYLDAQLVTPAMLRRASLRYAVGGVACVIAIAIAPLSTKVSIALYLFIAIFYLFPGGLEQNVVTDSRAES